MIEKYLITGFSGFVSHHFLDFLEKKRIKAQILGVDIINPEFNFGKYKYIKCFFERVDLLDKNQVDNIIYQFQPHYIVHLASFSSVAYSWRDPIASFCNNTNIFLNLLEKVRGLSLQCRILSVGSSEEYGNVEERDLPLVENRQLHAVSPYGVARISQEMLSQVYVEGYGQDIVMTRSFNHIGPRQKAVFAISSFAKQMAELKKSGEKRGVISAGDVEIIRDFLDVRDVVTAYYSLLKKGIRGDVYNICSGEGVTLREVIEKLADVAGLEITIDRKDHLVRPNDNKMIVGSNAKLRSQTAWKKVIPLDKTLEDLFTYWESSL